LEKRGHVIVENDSLAKKRRGTRWGKPSKEQKEEKRLDEKRERGPQDSEGGKSASTHTNWGAGPKRAKSKGFGGTVISTREKKSSLAHNGGETRNITRPGRQRFTETTSNLRSVEYKTFSKAFKKKKRKRSMPRQEEVQGGIQHLKLTAIPNEKTEVHVEGPGF